MKVRIEFELDVADLDESATDDLLADFTHEIRASRRLRTGTWRIDF